MCYFNSIKLILKLDYFLGRKPLSYHHLGYLLKRFDA